MKPGVKLLWKTAFSIFAFLSLLVFDSKAQFSNWLTLDKTFGSAVNWVDIDGDGDLDLTISGDDIWTNPGLGKLLINNTNNFSDFQIIRAMEDGDQSWCDFNHDGLPELLYAGTNTVPTAGIDLFDISDMNNLTYSSFTSGLTPVKNASVDWGDYDNDGDYDILIAGSDASATIITSLYRNDNGVFTDMNAGLPGIVNGKVAFIDYDLDQDLDIFICGGDINGNKYTRLWRNTYGHYAVTNDLFVNLRYSQFDWGDINNDGYPDLLLGGWDDSSSRGFIYINNAGTGFSQSASSVPGCAKGSSAIVDVDNDGDLDLIISGIKDIDNDKLVFLNDNAGTFTASGFTITPVTESYFQPGDYNHNNRLALVLNGKKSDGNGRTIIASNITALANIKPDAPLNPTATVEGTSVHLQWNYSADNNTPQKELTYNIYVGTTSHGIEIVSPNASVPDGFRRISRKGYIQDNGWTIKNLQAGTYYWGVQAIDNGLSESPFSEEGTFEIKDRFTDIPYTETPSVTTPALYFDCDHDGDLDLFLTHSDIFYVVENTEDHFLEANYRTIQSNGYNPVRTLTPNDYDNNDLIDFTISGDIFGGVSKSPVALYGYNAPFDYDIINSELIRDANFEYVIWADFNNDGKQDFIASGRTTNLGAGDKPVTYLYKNQGNGTFQEMTHTIRGFEQCGAVAGDFDNDMDIDIFIYGKDELGIADSYMYINEGDFSFTENLIPNNALFKDYPTFGLLTGDFDLNGELDILLDGKDSFNDSYAKVLLNHAMVFSDANITIRSSPHMSHFWADYDNDNDLDIYSTTAYEAPDKVRLYINNNGSMQEIITDLGTQQTLDRPFMAANLDNKNGLDFIMKERLGPFHQYFDNWGANEVKYLAPSNTRYQQDNLDIILQWDKIPNCPGCTYNVRVGTQSDKSDIMSPMSDPDNGYMYVIQPGNAYLNSKWKLSELPVGTYLWSVQAIYPSNTGGPWAPVQSFTVSQINTEFSFTTECLGDTITFEDLSVATDAVIKWKWDFGDGTESSVQNPVHLYTSSGTFIAGLWAYSLSGDSAYKSHEVTVKPIPLTTFTADIACQGSPTTIVNNTDNNGLTINSWQWNFGDGQTSSLQNPGTHGYIVAGSYKAELWAFASNGCHDSVSKNITVASYPVAVISANAPLTFCNGDSIILSVQYNNNYSYGWKLNGTLLTNSDTSRYVARLTGNYTSEITNPVGGCVAVSSQASVTVNASPAAPLIVVEGPTEICQGDSVVLSVTDTPGYTYQWKLNGGAVGTNLNKFVAKTTGDYNLLVTNSSGCSVSSATPVPVTVNPLPTLSIISVKGNEKFCSGGSATLSVPANADYAYNWRKGTNLLDITTNSILASEPGDYTVDISLDGCIVTAESVKIEVVEKPSNPDIDMGSYTKGMCLGENPLKLAVDDIVPGYSYQWYKNETPLSASTSIDVVEAGNYYLEAVTDICSSERDTAIISFAPGPAKPDIITRGPSVWILSTSARADKYKWYLNGDSIPGANQSSYLAGQKYGLYRLAVANESGCFSFSDTLRIPLGVTGIEDADPFRDVKIYPNPTTGTFTIEMNNNVFGELVIDIFTQTGSKALNIKFEKTTEHFSSQIDLSGQSKGMFLINLSIGEFKTVRKVLVD